MLVGVVSDTHDDIDRIELAIETFESEGVEVVIHCGDFVAPFAVDPFDAAFAFHAVRGNNDGEWALAESIEQVGTFHGELAELHLGGAEFAVYHGTAEPIVDALLECGQYEYVCRGHTHERIREQHRGTVHLNPGGRPIPGADDVFHVATVDTEAESVSHHPIE